MSIYIAAHINGSGVRAIGVFSGQSDLYRYCLRLTERHMYDTFPAKRATVAELCSWLADRGFGGPGSRYYYRISAADARRSPNSVQLFL